MPIRIDSWSYNETPKVVSVKNVPVGILRLALNIALLIFVFIYEFWYARGYQKFTGIQTSVTIKVKGLSM